MALDDDLMDLAGRRPAQKEESSEDYVSDDDGAEDGEITPDQPDEGTAAHVPLKKRGSGMPLKKAWLEAAADASAGKDPLDDDDDDDDGDEDEEDEDNDMAGYEPETGFFGEEDERRLMAMKEIEREMILAERKTKWDRLREEKRRKELQKMAEEAAKGRSRRSQRQKDSLTQKSKKKQAARELSQALASKKKQREMLEYDSDDEPEYEPVKKRAKKTTAAAAPRARRPSLDDDDEDEGDEDYFDEELEREEGQPAKGRRAPKTRKGRKQRDGLYDAERDYEEAQYGIPAELEEIAKIVVSRNTLADHCQKPSFAEGIRMCFVRIREGDKYRLYQIEDVVTCPRNPEELTHEEVDLASRLQIDITALEPYEVKGADGKKLCSTRQYIAVKVIRSDGTVMYDPIPIYSISSNAELSNDEYESWLARMRNSPGEQFTVQDADDALKSLNGLLEQKYSHDVVKRILENNKKEGKYSSMSRLKQQKQFELESAESRQDQDAIKRLRKEITELDVKAIELRKEESAKAKMSLADVNRRNQVLNFNMIVKQKAKAEDTGKSDLDPFSRRQTRSQNYWAVKKTSEEAEDDGKGEPAGDAKPASGVDEQQAAKEAEPNVDDILDGMDLDLPTSPAAQQVASRKLGFALLGSRGSSDALAQMGRAAEPAAPGTSSNQPPAATQRLSINDYKRRRGY